MEHNNRMCYPEGAIGVAQVGEKEWMFEYPRLNWEV